MTLADDFAAENRGLEEDYPTAFGITFTPTVTGIALAVLGVVGVGYIFINMVRPAQEQYQQASTKKQELQGQLEKIRSGDLQLKLAQLETELADKQVLKSRVISMFTSEEDLATLLLDLNSFIKAYQGELIQYQPDGSISTVEDGSLGQEVNGKIKRKGISLTIEASFNQTKSILQDLERLQPLLMIESISSTVSEKPTAILTSNRGEIVPQDEAELKTQIKLNAILPSSQQELEKAREIDRQAEVESKAEARRKRREERRNKDKRSTLEKTFEQQ